jgi:hypothetical protein
MPGRQFARLSIQDLEKLFDEKREKIDVLTSILNELGHRGTSRSKALKKRVMQGLSIAAVAGKSIKE